MDATRLLRVALFAGAFLFLTSEQTRAIAAPLSREETKLSILEGGVEEAEDSPFVSSTYRFLPGEFVFFTFKAAGFQTERFGPDLSKLSLAYEVTGEDAKGIALSPAATGEVKDEIGTQDKNWIPARRTSFLLPSYVAAGNYHVHVKVRDLIAKTETSRDFPFLVGGIELKPADSITAENVRLLRSEDAREPLQVAAYRAGDTIFLKFELTGFTTDAKNAYKVAYGLKVLRPDGKVYFEDPHAAELSDASFYPAQFVPGAAAIKTSPDSSGGQYTAIVTVRDKLSGRTSESRTTFQIE